MPLCPPIYRRSLHDALPISPRAQKALSAAYGQVRVQMGALLGAISEAVVGAATIRAYGAGARTGQRIERAISDHRNAAVRAQTLASLAFSSGEIGRASCRES